MPLMERDYKGPRNYRDGGIQNMCVQSFRKAQKAHDPDDCERWEEDDKIDTLSAHGTTSASAILQTVPRRLTPVECLRLQGFPNDWLEVSDADAEEAYAREVLHIVWRTAYQETSTERHAGVFAALQTPEILLTGVYGGWISWSVAEECAARRRQVQGEDYCGEGFLRALRDNAEAGRSPYRRESFEQPAAELGYPLSELPYEGAQTQADLLHRGLQRHPQGTQLLREALSAVQEMGRSVDDRVGAKTLADGPRYRMMGNAVTVTVAEWIGRRILAVENGDE